MKTMKFQAGIQAVLAGVLAVALCTGCGGAYDGITSAPEVNYSQSSGSVQDSIPSAAVGGSLYDGGGMQFSEGSGGIQDARKLITTVRIEMETKDYEQTMSILETQIREMGGYIESMEAYNGSSYSDSRGSRYSRMTIRIPAAQLDGFLNTVSDVGNVVRRSESGEDVTLSYVDMESRRDTLRTEQSRLLEFLDRADSIETVIALEERLSEVRYQLESMESKLRTLDNLVEYSTVNLNVTEVRELTPVAEQTAWEKVSSGFSRNVHNIGKGFLGLCIWFAINIPYLLVWGAVLWAVIWILRKRRRKIEEKMQNSENQQKKEAGHN